MKKGPLVAGIILLLIGAMGYVSASQSISEGQTWRGEAERILSNNSQTQYQQSGFAQLAFVALFVIGLGLLIYGAAATSSKTKSSVFNCKYCQYPAPSYLDLQDHFEYCKKKPVEQSKPSSSNKNERKYISSKDCGHTKTLIKKYTEICSFCGTEFPKRNLTENNSKPKESKPVEAQQNLDSYVAQSILEDNSEDKETINDIERNEKALGVLKERLAKGEISVKEYQEIKKELI